MNIALHFYQIEPNAIQLVPRNLFQSLYHPTMPEDYPQKPREITPQSSLLWKHILLLFSSHQCAIIFLLKILCFLTCIDMFLVFSMFSWTRLVLTSSRLTLISTHSVTLIGMGESLSSGVCGAKWLYHQWLIIFILSIMCRNPLTIWCTSRENRP